VPLSGTTAEAAPPTETVNPRATAKIAARLVRLFQDLFASGILVRAMRSFSILGTASYKGASTPLQEGACTTNGALPQPDEACGGASISVAGEAVLAAAVGLVL